jgi:hypothetical protein
MGFGSNTYLQGHSGNASRARDYGAFRFARSRVERRDLVHAGLEKSHMYDAYEEKEPRRKKE